MPCAKREQWNESPVCCYEAQVGRQAQLHHYLERLLVTLPMPISGLLLSPHSVLTLAWSSPLPSRSVHSWEGLHLPSGTFPSLLPTFLLPLQDAALRTKLLEYCLPAAPSPPCPLRHPLGEPTTLTAISPAGAASARAAIRGKGLQAPMSGRGLSRNVSNYEHVRGRPSRGRDGLHRSLEGTYLWSRTASPRAQRPSPAKTYCHVELTHANK